MKAYIYNIFDNPSKDFVSVSYVQYVKNGDTFTPKPRTACVDRVNWDAYTLHGMTPLSVPCKVDLKYNRDTKRYEVIG